MRVAPLYALRQDTAENDAILTAANGVLHRYPPDPGRQPHLVARIDDPRHADHWRGGHSGNSGLSLEYALSPLESTAGTLVNQIFAAGARHMLLCGDSTLALAILMELARRAWEWRELVQAASSGRAAHPDAVCLDETDQQVPAPHPVQRVVLLDRRAEDLRREFQATSPHSVTAAAPQVHAEPRPWREHLLGMLDTMPPAEAAQAAVVVADAGTDASLREVARVARLHPGIPLFVLTSDGAATDGAIFDRLLPFQRTFLVDGEEPEDTWTRVARHWHECYRMRHPAVPGEPRTSPVARGMTWMISSARTTSFRSAR